MRPHQDMPKKTKAVMALEPVDPLIREIRGERVMLDSDLARVYGVETKALNRGQGKSTRGFSG